jgi:DNA-binding transcriptional ArsR family regulator
VRGVSDGKSARSEAKRVLAYLEPRIHRMLAHPLRYAIFVKLSDGPATSAQVADMLGETPKYVSRQISELLTEHLVEVVDQRPNSQGGPVYRAVNRFVWNVEEWTSFPPLERENASVTICTMFNDELGRSLQSGMFDAHERRVLIRRPVWGDDQALAEIDEIYVRADEAVHEVERRSAERHHSGSRPHRIMTALFSFLVSGDSPRGRS